ncbi:MAG: hypothetical protein FJ272_21835, partial [Planctomycetes bacterium]|nr:hypothetical protein [Planctomycetota bacterium]
MLTIALCAVSAGGQENAAYPPDIAAWTDEMKESQRSAARALDARLKDAIAQSAPELRVEPG